MTLKFMSQLVNYCSGCKRTPHIHLDGSIQGSMHSSIYIKTNFTGLIIEKWKTNVSKQKLPLHLEHSDLINDKTGHQSYITLKCIFGWTLGQLTSIVKPQPADKLCT